MVLKSPDTARIFYFHVDNRKEIKEFWGELAARNGVLQEKEDASNLIREGSKSHGITTVSTIECEKGLLSISLFQNIVIISGHFRLGGSPSERIKASAFQDLPGMAASFGGATIIVSKKASPEEMQSALGRGYTRIGTRYGELYQFEEEEGHKAHFYYLSLNSEDREFSHFLSLHLPLFDLSIHKLHMERDYFKNQRRWILNEKAEIDKAIGEILHKRIAGETLNPEFIEALEKEVDTLSSKYAILVNDGHLIRKARSTLDQALEEVYINLNQFGSLPEGGLSILKETEELVKILDDDETSISFAIKNTKTAIDTVRTNVDLLRSRENILLQERGISYQVAAAVLEFIIIFYYSIASWEHLIGAQRMEFIPPTIRFIVIFSFTSLAVLLTHFVGESYREGWKLNKGAVIAGLALVAVFLYIVFLSIQTGSLPAEVAH